MNKIFYTLLVYTHLAITGCCFRGLCKVVTIYVHRSSDYDGYIGYKTRKKTPFLVLVEFPVSWLVE
jgi:hypothetical protein